VSIYKFERNRIKRASSGFYAWLWYHTEFWLDRPARRPYTYIMRDVYHNYPLIVSILMSAGAYALGRWLLPVATKTYLIVLAAVLVGALLGHLFWGGAYVAGQQEDPEYNPERTTH
jgi:nitrogen fixation-related uncharacterized protein